MTMSITDNGVGEGRVLTEKQMHDLKAVLDIQSDPGNWDYNEYMHGMLNGMELMMAIVEDREPVYKDEPHAFLEKRHPYPLNRKATPNE